MNRLQSVRGCSTTSPELHTWRPEFNVVPAWYLRTLTVLGCSFFLVFPPERPYGEEFVPAGHAAIRRYSEEPRDHCYTAGDMLGGNPLQFKIAADPAVGIHQIPKRSLPPAKPRFARFAAPRQDAAEAQQIVNDCPSPGATEFHTSTPWTNELRRLDLRSPRNGWTLKHGKKQTLCLARYNENPKE